MPPILLLALGIALACNGSWFAGAFAIGCVLIGVFAVFTVTVTIESYKNEKAKRDPLYGLHRRVGRGR